MFWNNRDKPKSAKNTRKNAWQPHTKPNLLDRASHAVGDQTRHLERQERNERLRRQQAILSRTEGHYERTTKTSFKPRQDDGEQTAHNHPWKAATLSALDANPPLASQFIADLSELSTKPRNSRGFHATNSENRLGIPEEDSLSLSLSDIRARHNPEKSISKTLQRQFSRTLSASLRPIKSAAQPPVTDDHTTPQESPIKPAGKRLASQWRILWLTTALFLILGFWLNPLLWQWWRSYDRVTPPPILLVTIRDEPRRDEEQFFRELEKVLRTEARAFGFLQPPHDWLANDYSALSAERMSQIVERYPRVIVGLSASRLNPAGNVSNPATTGLVAGHWLTLPSKDFTEVSRFQFDTQLQKSREVERLISRINVGFVESPTGSRIATGTMADRTIIRRLSVGICAISTLAPALFRSRCVDGGIKHPARPISCFAPLAWYRHRRREKPLASPLRRPPSDISPCDHGGANIMG
jgi:hypothetical protein